MRSLGKRRVRTNTNRKNAKLLSMCMPALLFLLLFNYIPMFGLILAFKDFRYNKGIFGSDWIGLENFKFFLISDNAWRITRNTLGFNLFFLFLCTSISVIFALLLNEIISKAARKFYQTAMFLPYFLSWVVVGYMAWAFLDQNNGIFNNLLINLGSKPILWYMEPNVWIFLLPFLYVWKSVGYNSVVYYASLMSIDNSYYEAASLDGANKLQKIWYITLPHLKPLIIMMTILGIGKIFNADFGLFYQATMDSSALYPVTDVLDTFVYRALRVTGDVGMSSAVGFYQSVVGFILVLASNALVRKIDKESAMF